MAADAQPMITTTAFRQNAWTRQQPRLPEEWLGVTSEWPLDEAPYIDYVLYQALVEIDVLAATALGLPQDELQTIDCVQVPVMPDDQSETYYGVTGRTVFARSKEVPAVGVPRKRNLGSASTAVPSERIPAGLARVTLSG